ncbi:MAG: bacteriophage CI repressor [Nitrospirae bacterium]|nr:bacteriophage CI repressor [Candidatus Manganitrophaceae bacterium]
MSRLNDIIDRIKEISHLRTDAEVAKKLGLKPNTLSERKARDSVPFEEIFRYCVQNEIYLDWVLTGIGSKLKTRNLVQESHTHYTTASPDSGPYDEKVGELKRAIETTTKIAQRYNLALNDVSLSLIVDMVYIHALSDDAIRDLFRLLSAVKDFWSIEKSPAKNV